MDNSPDQLTNPSIPTRRIPMSKQRRRLTAIGASIGGVLALICLCIGGLAAYGLTPGVKNAASTRTGLTAAAQAATATATINIGPTQTRVQELAPLVTAVGATATPQPPTATPILPTTIPVAIASTATPAPLQPTPTPVPPKLTPTTSAPATQAGAIVTVFQSGGLGLDQSAWEQLHGSGSKQKRGGITKGGITSTEYENGTFVVWVSNNHIEYIQRAWLSTAPASPDEAQATINGLLPKDAQVTQTGNCTTGRKVCSFTQYKSESLRNQFPPDSDRNYGIWAGGQAGDFIVIIRGDTKDKITSVEIQTGAKTSNTR